MQGEIQAQFRPYYVVNLVWLPTLLIALGLWILGAHPSADWALAAVVMLVLAAGILFLLRRALARFGGNAMTVNAEGIDHWTWGFIPWSDIENVDFIRATPGFTFTYFVRVSLRDSRQYLGNVGRIERWLRTKSVRTATGYLDLLVSGLQPGPEEIHQVAKALLEQHSR